MFFSTARTAASRAAIARRTYATKQAGESFPEESFNSSIWRNTVIAVAAGALWLRFDNSSEDNKHLFTKWIEGLMTSSEKMDSLSNEALAQAEKLAEYRLIAQDAQRAPIYRMRYPEGFERASPRGLIAGQQADLSDLKVRTD
ncbi:hypothetical protein O0I10_001217 [Lichtheimia ornata]|uniref:Uncharacterized protein n=1 Tax=Lichtheimia ornata TaxID=688661 RepID=A0AAD7Y3C5_9FUNG|nr:uncharacterized protein O0I10_001217 [Lichtheimia ornata]KAJ8663040.1 hypothetical protein O0I10_001217 [Lichtheimia ornata]